ncbi:MAG: hypothetical protein M1824_005606 [Vezdaea acicularis]|nr:MAG: hypothetical protein M1824_005606 [Vezdaea acicularis]
MPLHTGLDAHAAPPPGLRQIFKRYQSAAVDQLDGDADIIDLKNGLDLESRHGISQIGTVNSAELASICARFEGNELARSLSLPETEDYDRPILHVDSVPGLILIPSLLPPSTQLTLLNRLLHRDASSPSHRTNIHLHHQLPPPSPTFHTSNSTPTSFFTLSPTSPPLTPLNPSTHNPLPITSFLHKKLRWITLGAQYDWTSKTYPNAPNTPSFPPDLAALLNSLFPQTTPHAAIINIYSPGHTLSLHRDLSEASPAGLISLSLGCDCIFVIGPDPLPSPTANAPDEAAEVDETNDLTPNPHATLRLRSGDAVYMSAASRYAWHGVAKIVGGTCPAWMAEWPGGGLSADGLDADEEQRFEAWKGWMGGRRVNLNVRQMWDGSSSGG